MELREKIIETLGEFYNGPWDEAADAILAIPEIAEALADKAEADEAVGGGGYYLRCSKRDTDRYIEALRNA